MFLVIIYGMNNHFIVQLKLLHPVQCMAFAKLSLVEISKAKHNAAFSCRVPLGACDRAGEEEILFKNPRDFWRFLHSADILDVLLCGLAKSGRSTMGLRITNGG